MMKFLCTKCDHVFVHEGIKEKFNSAIYGHALNTLLTARLAKQFATNIEKPVCYKKQQQYALWFRKEMLLLQIIDSL